MRTREKRTDKVSSYARHAPRDPVITTSQFSIKECRIRLRSTAIFLARGSEICPHTASSSTPSWTYSLIIVPRTIYLLSSPNRFTHSWISIVRLVIYNRRKVWRSCARTANVGPVAGVCGSGYFMSCEARLHGSRKSDKLTDGYRWRLSSVSAVRENIRMYTFTYRVPWKLRTFASLQILPSHPSSIPLSKMSDEFLSLSL